MASVEWVNGQILDVVRRINEYAEQNDGEISDELLEELDKWEGAKDGAIDEMAIQYKSLVTKVDMIKAQEKALKELRDQVVIDAESVKKTLGIVLHGEKFTSKNSSVGFRKSTSTHVYDENLLPDEFIITKETVSISKSEIGEALKSGRTVDGAVLETKYSVVIK